MESFILTPTPANQDLILNLTTVSASPHNITCNQSIWNYLVSTSEVAAAAKSLQSCPTLCDPRDSSPPGSPVPGILQARILEWVAISFSNACQWKVKVKSLPSMGFSRQEYWSGLPLPSPTSEVIFPIDPHRSLRDVILPDMIHSLLVTSFLPHPFLPLKTLLFPQLFGAPVC